ncbi:MAG: LysR family transcriptional regulator [Thermoguttaceae bacterium]|nr:LysR family transcriptional regulator [Thermoguttaceae bacterium]
MKIDSVRLFCDIIRRQSFSRGAALHSVSQSAATQMIQRMEEEFQVPLIDRSRRPLVPTPEGRLCYDCFQEMVDRYDALKKQLQTLHEQAGGLIRVAAIYSIGLHEMSQHIQYFMKSYPKVTIKLEYLPPSKVYQAVLSSDVDFGLVSYPKASFDLKVVPLRSEEMVAVLPINHPLVEEKQLSIKQLEGFDFVAFDPDLPIRGEIDQIFERHGVTVSVTMEFDNIETIKQAVEIGLGISILPAPTVQDAVDAGKVAAVPIIEPKITRPIGIIHLQNKIFPPAAMYFIEMLTRGIPEQE